MDSPLVSIGLTAYNRPQTLVRTLQSLLSQTYTNLEIIISDDCSPNPEVERVARDFTSDPRVKYYRQPVNKGPIHNFNSVLEKLRGDYFMRIADDDWLEQDYILECVKFLSANADYTAVYGRANIYSIEGFQVSKDEPISMEHESPKYRLQQYLRTVGFNGCYYAVMRSSNRKFCYSRNILGMDWIIVCRVAFNGKYKMLEGVNSNISLGGDSETIAKLTASYSMSKFIRAFPYLSISINLLKDFIFNSSLYRSYNFVERVKLGVVCFQVVSQRFSVKNELRPGIKTFTKMCLAMNKTA